MSRPPDSPGRARQRDPRLFRVGVFALIALVLCIGVVLALGGRRWFERSATLETLRSLR